MDETSNDWGGEGHRITFAPAPVGDLKQFLRYWEGLPGGKPALKAYADQGGVITIGYGHTGPGVKVDSTVTFDEAEELLHCDIEVHASDVMQLLRFPKELQPYQIDALTSFCFNLGRQRLASSTLLLKINSHFYGNDEVGPEFDKWVYDGAVRVPGLIKRRAAERAMYERDDYSGRP